MDTESRLHEIEAHVHQIKTLAWVALIVVVALFLAVCLGLVLVALHFGFLRVTDLWVYLGWILVALALIPIVYLLVLAAISAASGLGQFWTSRAADAELQDRILREIVAERAKTRDHDPNS